MRNQKKNLKAYRGVLKNKNLNKILEAGFSAPVGSTKRKHAQKVFSILNKLQDDGQGGPGPQMPKVNVQLRPRVVDYSRMMVLPDIPKVRVPIGTKAPIPFPTYDGAGYAPMGGAMDGAGYTPMGGGATSTPVFGMPSNMGMPGGGYQTPGQTSSAAGSFASGVGSLTGGAWNKYLGMGNVLNKNLAGAAKGTGKFIKGVTYDPLFTPAGSRSYQGPFDATSNSTPFASGLNANPYSNFGTQPAQSTPGNVQFGINNTPQSGGNNNQGSDGKVQGPTQSQAQGDAAAGEVGGGKATPYSGGASQAAMDAGVAGAASSGGFNSFAANYPNLVQSAVDQSMGPTMFALSSMQRGADYLKQLPGMDAFSDEVLNGKGTLAERINDTQVSLRKSHKLDQLLNNYVGLVNGGGMLQNNMVDYVRGRDEFLNETDSLITKMKNASLATDTSDPRTRANMSNHMNYLYEMRGRQNKRYVEFLSMSTDMYNSKVTAAENLYNTQFSKYEQALSNETAITTESYNQLYTGLQDLYQTVAQAPLYQAEIEKAQAAAQGALVALGQDAAGINSIDDTAPVDLFTRLKTMNYIDKDGRWVNNGNALYAGQNAQHFIPVMQDAVKTAVLMPDEDGNLPDVGTVGKSIANALGHIEAMEAAQYIDAGYAANAKDVIMGYSRDAMGTSSILQSDDMGTLREAMQAMKPKSPWLWKNTPTPSKEDFIKEWSEANLSDTVLGFLYDRMKNDTDNSSVSVEEWVETYTTGTDDLQQNNVALNDNELRSRILNDYANSFTAEQIGGRNGASAQSRDYITKLADTIGWKESGNNYNSRDGLDGEKGAYQFMPDTWKAYAGEILGDPNAAMTAENQRTVVEGKVAQWAMAGHSPQEIFAMWNAGPGKPEAWDPTKVWDYNGQRITGWAATNKGGNTFDTPLYVQQALEHFAGL